MRSSVRHSGSICLIPTPAFVVGLSIGSLDDRWAGRIELGTSRPSMRLGGTRALQDAGVPTFGMACPVFPDVLEEAGVETLIDRIRPNLVETLWAEPFNDRANWGKVRDGYLEDSTGMSSSPRSTNGGTRLGGAGTRRSCTCDSVAR